MASPNIAAIEPVIPPAPGRMAPQAGEGASPESGMAMQHTGEQPAPALTELAKQADALMDQMAQVMSQHPNPRQDLLLSYARRFLQAAVSQSLAPGKAPAPGEAPGAAKTQKVPA